MKRFLGIAAASLALISAQHAAAQSFTTAPVNTAVTYDGTVIVQKGLGIPLTCTLSIDIENTGSGYEAKNPSLTGSGGACNTVVFMNAPWPVVNTSGNLWQVGVTGGGSDEIFVDTTITAGDCKGHLVLEYTGTDEFTLETGFSTPSTIPQDVSGGDCKIDGIIDNP
ncbi:MAG TPA: hypothetical protein VLG14_06815 [Sphingomonas sp.]|nr:hypothetical protein [Sphingomonas sp.]